MKYETSFSHSGNIGDVWASLPALKRYHEMAGKRVCLYLVNEQRGTYYDGAYHPTKNEAGQQVMLNKKMIDMMIPLLDAQPYIQTADMYSEEIAIEIDLDEIRRSYVGAPSLSINRWYFYIWPDMACNTTQAWLTIPPTEKDLAKGKVLINRTDRYTNEKVNYEFLKQYEDDCLFIGTPREYNNFCMAHNLNIKRLIVKDFLEYAQAIQQSRFYVSNQSQGFQLAQGLDHPRILEVCPWAANVIVYGDHAFDFLHQLGLEYYFERLYEGDSRPSEGVMEKWGKI